MKLIKRFLFMIQFLTTIPINVNLNVKEEDCGKGLIFAPCVGLILGALLVVVQYFASFVFPPYITAALIIIVYILLTGALHIDGLGDTFDGLFSNRPRERILEIMKDSRVGTNAVVAIICIILLDILLVLDIEPVFLLFMPVAGRLGILTSAGSSSYARSGGLGKSFIDCCTLKDVLLGLIIYSVLFISVMGLRGGILIAATFVVSFLLTRSLSRKIGGTTGDILGAICELSQLFYLMAVYIIGKYM
ncbi:MAG: adenosylcobinamide-GDP ribazoletransferase [Clostridia bacterium]|nr:adenosylcobinamide-GDP ribazoletransferase [Clostridia bacterium]